MKCPPFIFVSGQLPIDKEGTTIDGSIAEQTAQCITNMSRILKAANSDLSNVVKVTVFLTSMSSFADMNSVYERYFPHRPARSCVAVKELPKGFPVELECIALVNEKNCHL